MRKTQFYTLRGDRKKPKAVLVLGVEDENGWLYYKDVSRWYLIEPNTGLSVAHGARLKDIRLDVLRTTWPENLQNLTERVKTFLDSEAGQKAIQTYQDCIYNAT